MAKLVAGLRYKVVGSIPEGVFGIFLSLNPSDCTMALRSIQLLTEMSTGDIFYGDKGGRCVGLTALPRLCADCLEMWEPQHRGTLRACPGQKWDSFYSIIMIYIDKRMF